MKKTIQSFLIAGLLALSTISFGQNANANFISKIAPPIPVLMTETADLRVSFIDGMVDTENAFSLSFQNKSNSTITFSWTLKDKSGKPVGEKHIITLTANSTLDYSSKNEFSNSMVFVISKNEKASDYTIEIGN